jgi:hypothetical protein
LGSRLWGMSLVLWMIVSTGLHYPLYVRLLTAIVFTYFIIFGNSRFTEEYKKII